MLLADTGAQTVKATYAYEPYGKQDTSVSRGDNDLENSFNPYRYTAKRWDSGSAQLDMGFRNFSTDIGRFMQPDVYGGALADLGLSMDPITGGNRYSLAGGNPIGFIEVDGHGVIDENGNNTGLPRGTTSAGGGGGSSGDLNTILRRGLAGQRRDRGTSSRDGSPDLSPAPVFGPRNRDPDYEPSDTSWAIFVALGGRFVDILTAAPDAASGVRRQTSTLAYLLARGSSGQKSVAGRRLPSYGRTTRPVVSKPFRFISRASWFLGGAAEVSFNKLEGQSTGEAVTRAAFATAGSALGSAGGGAVCATETVATAGAGAGLCVGIVVGASWAGGEIGDAIGKGVFDAFSTEERRESFLQFIGIP